MSTPILIVSYFYPRPDMGWGDNVGGERMRQFVQRLPRYGFEPWVLTHHAEGARELMPGVRAARDISRTVALGLSRRRHEAPTRARWQTSALRDSLQRWVLPDRASFAWAPWAIDEALRMGRERRPALILSSSPPIAGHEVAFALSRAWGVPWLADIRDGYAFEPPEGAGATRAARHLIERALYSHASRVIAVTDVLRDDLRTRLPSCADRIVTITNGYDDTLFAAPLAPRVQRASDWEIVYTGSSNTRQGQGLQSFLAGADRFASQCADAVHVRLVGLFAPDEAANNMMHAQLDIAGWQPRTEVAQIQRAADVLVVSTGNHPSVATTKVFEYIGAGRPILVIGRMSTAARIVTEGGFGIAVDDDAGDIAAAFARLHAERALWHERLRSPAVENARTSFSREAKTQVLVQHMRDVLNEAARQPDASRAAATE